MSQEPVEGELHEDRDDTQTVAFRIRKSEAEELDALAKAYEITRSVLLRSVLRKYLRGAVPTAADFKKSGQ